MSVLHELLADARALVAKLEAALQDKPDSAEAQPETPAEPAPPDGSSADVQKSSDLT